MNEKEKLIDKLRRNIEGAKNTKESGQETKQLEVELEKVCAELENLTSCLRIAKEQLIETQGGERRYLC